MSTARWPAARALFDEALARPAGERRAFVERRAADDPELAAEVLSLLAAHERAGDDFLAGAALGAPEEETPPAPTAIGAWRILGELGRGGMGVVYLGERTAGDFEQRVAIKLVSAGAANREILRRFANERRIVASLEHPGIARLLDGGTTADGLPYFVLEHVEGETLIAHADRQGLDLRARLRLFLEVCAAVEYAHRRLVIHRDLKPGNILVGRDGHAKLLDFGIARFVSPAPGEEEAAATVTLGRFLTPAYASPEQIRGEATTTATDVYSLGVVLFELLAGAPPFASVGRSAAALERDVLEREPPRPSAVARARRAGDAAARLSRTLAGDLDTIVGKALAKEPARRYGSVAELAADLECHLAGRPVTARTDSASYRAAKFVRRHRFAVAAAALATLALLAGLALALAANARAQRAEALARQQAATAERVSEFLVGLFRISDPGEARGNAVPARELLDRGAAAIAADLAAEPAVRARLQGVIGRAYLALGLYEPARSTLAAQRALVADLDGAESVAVAAVLARLSEVEMRRADYQRALELARQAAAIQERAFGGDHLDLAASLSQVGLCLWQLGDPQAARPELERALAMRERLLDAFDPGLGGILNNVANLRWQLGEAAAARPLYERALAIFERAHGEDHPYVAHTLNNLALVDLQIGDHAAARALHKRALAIRRRLLEPNHPDVAESLNNLGEVERAAGNLAAARASFGAALAIREKVLGGDHPDVGVTLNNLGTVALATGELAAARAHLARALAIFEARLGPEHSHLSYPLAGLAEVTRRQDSARAAEPLYRRAFELRARGLGAGHPDLVDLRRDYVALLRELGRDADAERLAAPAAPAS